MKKEIKPESKRGLEPLFGDRTVASLEQKLSKLAMVREVAWEFKEEEDTLELSGLIEESITFRHPNSARAFLDAYLMGYDHGYGDGARGEES